MIKQNAQNAREAKGVAEHARSSADKGVESMNRMSSAINKIKTSSDSTARIVKTIDEIAFPDQFTGTECRGGSSPGRRCR